MLSKAPNSVLIVCATSVIIAALACLTTIALLGGDSTEVSRYINTILNVGGFLMSTGALGFAASASKRSDDAAKTAELNMNQKDV